MGAAFFALRQALVDPVTVGLVANDENAAIGQGRGRAEDEGTGQSG